MRKYYQGRARGQLLLCIFWGYSVIIIFIKNIGAWYYLYILYLLSPFAPVMLLALNFSLLLHVCFALAGVGWGVHICLFLFLCFNFVLSSFLKFLMAFSWSTAWCCFLLYSKVSQLYKYLLFFWFLLSCPSFKCISCRHYIARSYF